MRSTIRPKKIQPVAAAGPVLYGLMAEFDTPEHLLEAAQKSTDAGYTRLDAYTPFPVEGMAEAVGFHKSRFPWVIFGGALTGLASAVLLVFYAAYLDYPLVVAGRQYFNWQPSVPIFFELTILFGAFSTVLGLMVANHLPEPYHPVFNAPRFERASQDAFFLCIEASDPQFDRRLTQQFLDGMRPMAVSEVNS